MQTQTAKIHKTLILCIYFNNKANLHAFVQPWKTTFALNTKDTHVQDQSRTIRYTIYIVFIS